MYSDGTTPKLMLIAKNYVDMNIGTHCYRAERSAERERMREAKCNITIHCALTDSVPDV